MIYTLFDKVVLVSLRTTLYLTKFSYCIVTEPTDDVEPFPIANDKAFLFFELTLIVLFETFEFLILTEPTDDVEFFPIARDTALSFCELTLILLLVTVDLAIAIDELNIIAVLIVAISRFFMGIPLYLCSCNTFLLTWVYDTKYFID